MSGRAGLGVSTRLWSICQLEYESAWRCGERPELHIAPLMRCKTMSIRKKHLTSQRHILIIQWSMSQVNPENSKSKALRAKGSLHPHPERVEDEQFRTAPMNSSTPATACR